MKRSTIDTVISTVSLVIAVALILAACGLFYAQSFIHGQVVGQLQSEKITFPAADSASLAALPEKDRQEVAKYAGQQLVNGAQAEVFADHYIAVHLDTIGGGKTYAELSAESLQNPTDTALAAKVETVFRGQTLRGLLLNAYAFDTMGTVALAAGYGAAITAAILAFLSALGFSHAKRAAKKNR